MDLIVPSIAFSKVHEALLVSVDALLLCFLNFLTKIPLCNPLFCGWIHRSKIKITYLSWLFLSMPEWTCNRVSGMPINAAASTDASFWRVFTFNCARSNCKRKWKYRSDEIGKVFLHLLWVTLAPSAFLTPSTRPICKSPWNRREKWNWPLALSVALVSSGTCTCIVQHVSQ